MPYIWLAVLVVAVIAEAFTHELVALWFIPAALVSVVLAFCQAPFLAQLLCFIFIGLALVISIRPLCHRFFEGKKERTNANALVGQIALVTEEIRNIDEVGEVKVGGLCWSARAEDPARVIAVGEQVEILEIRGVKLIVR